jgi:hypothetical protein
MGLKIRGSPLNQDGQAALPFVLLFALIFAGGMSLLYLRFQFRADVHRQRRLDQCIHDQASKLLSIQRSIERSNVIILAARATIAATSVSQPPVAAAARVALAAVVNKQNAELLLWEEQRGRWIVRSGCDGKNDRPLWFPGLPSLAWKRLPPDPIGQQGLQWVGEKSVPLKLVLKKGNRLSYAEVTHKKAQWHAHWRSWTRIN